MSRIADNESVSIQLSGLELESETATKFAHVALYKHPQLGRVLTLNGEIQHVEVWAPLYHEPLVHIPAAFIERPRSALVLGGASFFAATELLKYGSIQRVLMLDRDHDLVRLMMSSYEHARVARDDPRLEIRFEDAFQSVPRLNECFDLVINDAVDLLATCGDDALAFLAQALTPNGVCADVVYRHIFERYYSEKTVQLLSRVSNSVMALISVPEYPGVLHFLTVWGHNSELHQTVEKPANLQQIEWTTRPHENPCEYFDPRFLRYYLHLPGYIRRAVGGAKGTHV